MLLGFGNALDKSSGRKSKESKGRGKEMDDRRAPTVRVVIPLFLARRYAGGRARDTLTSKKRYLKSW